MKNVFLAIAVFALLFQSTPANEHSLQGLDVFNTGTFDCTNSKNVIETTWQNTLGNLRIYNALLWVGATGGTVADIGTIVYRASDETIFFHQNWDHYAEPTGIHTDRLDLTPNYIELKQGDLINMAYWCQSFNDLPSKAHIIITIWFSVEVF